MARNLNADVKNLLKLWRFQINSVYFTNEFILNGRLKPKFCKLIAPVECLVPEDEEDGTHLRKLECMACICCTVSCGATLKDWQRFLTKGSGQHPLELAIDPILDLCQENTDDGMVEHTFIQAVVSCCRENLFLQARNVIERFTYTDLLNKGTLQKLREVVDSMDSDHEYIQTHTYDSYVHRVQKWLQPKFESAKDCYIVKIAECVVSEGAEVNNNLTCRCKNLSTTSVETVDTAVGPDGDAAVVVDDRTDRSSTRVTETGSRSTRSVKTVDIAVGPDRNEVVVVDDARTSHSPTRGMKTGTKSTSLVEMVDTAMGSGRADMEGEDRTDGSTAGVVEETVTKSRKRLCPAQSIMPSALKRQKIRDVILAATRPSTSNERPTLNVPKKILVSGKKSAELSKEGVGKKSSTNTPSKISSEPSKKTVEHLKERSGKKSSTKTPSEISSELSEKTVEHLKERSGKKSSTKTPSKIPSEPSEKTVEHLKKRPGKKSSTKTPSKVSSEPSEKTVEHLKERLGKKSSAKTPSKISSELSKKTVEHLKERAGKKSSTKTPSKKSSESSLTRSESPTSLYGSAHSPLELSGTDLDSPEQPSTSKPQSTSSLNLPRSLFGSTSPVERADDSPRQSTSSKRDNSNVSPSIVVESDDGSDREQVVAKKKSRNVESLLNENGQRKVDARERLHEWLEETDWLNSKDSIPTKSQRWTERESELLFFLVHIHRKGQWNKILSRGKFHGRTNVQLKDRWRTMEKNGYAARLAKKFDLQ